jgi:hypothetical protein
VVFFGGHLTLPKYEIVDCGAFYEVIVFCISPRNLLGDFFYSLNDRGQPPSEAVGWTDMLCSASSTCRSVLIRRISSTSPEKILEVRARPVLDQVLGKVSLPRPIEGTNQDQGHATFMPDAAQAISRSPLNCLFLNAYHLGSLPAQLKVV